MLKLNTTGIILSFTMKLEMWGHLLLLATSLTLGGNIGVNLILKRFHNGGCQEQDGEAQEKLVGN